MTTATVLKWHGGKSYLAPKIIALMPKHIHYVEPYFGGGSVLLAKDPEGVSEVVNDKNCELTNFWNCLKDGLAFRLMRRYLEATPFSEDVWNDIGQWLATSPGAPVDHAVAFFIHCRQSLAGRMKDFATLSRTRTRRGMNEQASAWLTAIEGLPAVHERLKRVVILNRDALDVIVQQDGPGTVFYCDPPYLHDTRACRDAYAHEMTAAQHADLLAVLGGIKGRFLLSGYDHLLYQQAEIGYGWKRHEFELPNNAAGGSEKRRMREVLWQNF